MIPRTDARPLIVAVAGSNGAGKSTFHDAFLSDAGLRFINAGVLARGLELDPYAGARLADALRRQLVEQRESFIFETVFSDPDGNKLDFLQQAAASGYHVILCFIGISGVDTSEERVEMRVSQGGHDVPGSKLSARFPRTLANLKRAIPVLPQVLIFDNNDLANPFRLAMTFENGKRTFAADPVPQWLNRLLK